MLHKSFDTATYINKLENLNDKPKVRFFLKSLKSDMDVESATSPDLFEILDGDYLLQSIQKYLSFSPSRQAARDYRRTILALCESVCSFYGIRNSFLESVSEREGFDKTANELISQLREPTNREIMSFEDFETLDEAIKDFLDMDDLEYHIIQSIKSINSKPNHYGWLVSAIALRLVQFYGLDNQAIADIKLSDLNLEARILDVKGFQLHINTYLASIFALYVRYRTVVTSTTKTQSDYLFIKRNGAPYLNNLDRSDNGQLFLILDTILGHTTSSSLRYRTIFDLMSKGSSIHWLSQLTKVSIATINNICIDDDKSSFEHIFVDTEPQTTAKPQSIKKGLMQCTYCGEYHESISENWILIQIPGDTKKHLACRGCMGLDGKCRY